MHSHVLLPISEYPTAPPAKYGRRSEGVPASCRHPWRPDVQSLNSQLAGGCSNESLNPVHCTIDTPWKTFLSFAD